MNKLNQEAILHYLRENKDFLRAEFGVTQIALFGSFARNEARYDSDVDLLIECKRVCIINSFYLREYLEKAFGRKVDIAHFESVRRFYRRRIDKDLVYA